MAPVEIVQVHNNPTGSDNQSKLNDEYIVIKNTSSNRYNLTGWRVSDRTATGQETHLFRFPATLGFGTSWTLAPGQYIFLMTDSSIDQLVPDNKRNAPQYHFFMQHNWFIWNNSGDTAYLRLPNGEFEHWMKVPSREDVYREAFTL